MTENQLEVCDIVFERNYENAIANTMAWFMGSKWSHVFNCGVFGQLHETDSYTYNSKSHLSKYMGTNHELEVWRIPMNETQKILMLKKQMTLFGTTYGYLQLPWLAVRCFFRRALGIILPNIIRQGFVCAHGVMYGLREAGIKCPEPESIDTEEFYEWIKNCSDAKLMYHKPKGHEQFFEVLIK